jgi:uncharacterized membrane protein HdeD (DUF308 family)
MDAHRRIFWGLEEKMTISPDMLTELMSRPSESVSWVMVGIFSAWGGVVRYLMDSRGRKRKHRYMEAISQIIISGFTGFLGGLYSFEQGNSPLMTLIMAGICSTLGSTLLIWLWRQILPEEGNKQ